MKKLLFVLTILGVIFLFNDKSSYAQSGMMGDYYNSDSSQSSVVSQTEQDNQQKFQLLVNDILKSQGVTSVDKLDCSKIPSDQLEKLGDSWMDVMIPNENAHENMDNVMGGEGSETLSNMHIGMAKRYLGCKNANYGWMGTQNLENGGEFNMMGWGGYGAGMMGNFGWGLGLAGILFWMVAFADLVLLGIFLWKKIKK